MGEAPSYIMQSRLIKYFITDTCLCRTHLYPKNAL